MGNPTPQVNAFILCDLAFQQAMTGKWCVIGTFSVIWARQFPVRHSPLVVFIELGDFTGDTQVAVHLRNPEGEMVTAVRAQIPKIPMTTAEFALPFPPVELKDAGSYTLELHAGEQLLALRTLRVMKAPEQPQGTMPGGMPPGLPQPPEFGGPPPA